MRLNSIILVALVCLVCGLQACRSEAEEEEINLRKGQNQYETVYLEENQSMEKLDMTVNIGPVNLTVKNPLTNNLWHHGWTPSPNEVKQWDAWYKDYKVQYNSSVIDIVEPNKQNEFEEERGPGSGWPMRWADAGVGLGGAPPPPWAYAPKNTGKPSFCFLPPRQGVCVPGKGVNPKTFKPPKPTARFAYHPYKDECVPFIFSGCSGNRNNFVTMRVCEEYCVAPIPFNGCDIESHIYIDDAVAY